MEIANGLHYLWSMSDVTQILLQIEHGSSNAADELLPLVYEELRRLSAAKLANEKPGQTLQATALVHEAYVRLVDQAEPQQWDNSRHFFSAAAESMRRILIERARARASLKRGGDRERVRSGDRRARDPAPGVRRHARVGRSPAEAGAAASPQGGAGEAAVFRRSDHGPGGQGAGDLHHNSGE